MKLKTLVKLMTPQELARMARLARTTQDQIRYQLANGHRRPSIGLAQRLVRASQDMFPDDQSRWLHLREWFSMDVAA